jgi:hypothetical protein
MVSTVVAQIAAATGGGGGGGTLLTVTESTVRSVTHVLLDLLRLEAPAPYDSAGTVAAATGGAWTSLHCEILNAFMDWYGVDEFYPSVFEELHVLPAVRRSLQTIATFPTTTLSPEEEEVLYNTERFVEYKEQQQQQQQQQQQH